MNSSQSICLARRFLGFAAALLATGCEIKIEPPASKPPPAIRVPAAQAAIIGKGEESKQQAAAQKSLDHLPPQPDRRRKDSRLPTKDLSDDDLAEAKFKFNVHQAVDRIGAEIRDALSLRKTLVVLLVEQTDKSSSLSDRIAQQIAPLAHNLTADYPGRFQMAIIGYAGEPNLLTPTPTADADQIDAALTAAKQTSDNKANTFAAFNLAVEKFLPYRYRGYEVILVVAGTSSGDDLNLADPAIIPLKRAAVPVYGIGPAMPFGSPRNFGKNSRPGATAANSYERRFESLGPERLQLALSGNQTSIDLNDSGYGPFGLERVCRMTQGKFYRLRNNEPPGWATDPKIGDIKSELHSKYAPDYVDEQQYDRLLAANKCRQALHDAALLPPAEGLESVRADFPKQQDEAALAKLITTAQKAAAIRDQPIEKLYDTLIAGESDRPKLTGARWQAGYDLALGQVLAAKARLDGFNAMLALLKQGKTFANANSTRWVLEPADEIAAGSVLDKMAKKSRTYLHRVVTEHPGTPWAAIAQRELRYPAGWKLIEK